MQVAISIEKKGWANQKGPVLKVYVSNGDDHDYDFIEISEIAAALAPKANDEGPT